MVADPIVGRASAVEPSTPAEQELAQRLYERHERTIYAHCLSRLRKREDAEDATQVTFLNAFRSVRRGVLPELELAWLFAIANHVIANRRRADARRRRVELPHDLSQLEDVFASPQGESEELIRLAEALAAMPDAQRRALLLREWQGLSCREIADDLAIGTGAVEALLFRARRTLQEELTRPSRRRRAGDLQVGSLLVRLKGLMGAGAAVKLLAATIGMVGAVGTVGSPVRTHPPAARVRVHAAAPAPARYARTPPAPAEPKSH